MATRTKRSGFDRTMQYFREVSHDEAEAAYMLVSKIMSERNGSPKRKARTSKATSDGPLLDSVFDESPIAAARAKRASAGDAHV